MSRSAIEPTYETTLLYVVTSREEAYPTSSTGCSWRLPLLSASFADLFALRTPESRPQRAATFTFAARCVGRYLPDTEPARHGCDARRAGLQTAAGVHKTRRNCRPGVRGWCAPVPVQRRPRRRYRASPCALCRRPCAAMALAVRRSSARRRARTTTLR